MKIDGKKVNDFIHKQTWVYITRGNDMLDRILSTVLSTWMRKWQTSPKVILRCYSDSGQRNSHFALVSRLLPFYWKTQKKLRLSWQASERGFLSKRWPRRLKNLKMNAAAFKRVNTMTTERGEVTNNSWSSPVSRMKRFTEYGSTSGYTQWTLTRIVQCWKRNTLFYIRTSKFGAEAERSLFCDLSLKTFLTCS